MADSNITGLTAAASALSTDLLYMGRSPFGATDDRKITFANLQTSVLSGATLATVLTAGNSTGATDIIVTAAQKITTDTISETTAASGVTIDGVLLKDGLVGSQYGGTGQNLSASTGIIQVSGGTMSANTALANGTTATTQAASDNSTKVATTAYVDAIPATISLQTAYNVSPTIAIGAGGPVVFTVADTINQNAITVNQNDTTNNPAAVTLNNAGTGNDITSTNWSAPKTGILSTKGELIYAPTNDANPQIRIGSSDAEEVHIQAVYDSGAQTLDYVLFQTDVASGTADKGQYIFNVDGVQILSIDDGGLEIDVAGGTISTAGVTLAGGTNTFSLTNGTASLDVAAGSTVNIDASLTVESASLVNQDLTSDATPTFANLTLSNGEISIDPTPGTDLTGTGIVISATVDTNATGVGAALYLASDGHYDEADADAASTMPCTAVALETSTGTKKVLLQGFIRKDAWNWTPGGVVYVDTTTGGFTQTAPSGTGDVVQAVGIAYTADILYFKPDLTMITIV